MSTHQQPPRRNPIKRIVELTLDKLAASYRFTQAWREANRDLVSGAQAARPEGLSYTPPPAEYGCATLGSGVTGARADGARPLFVTARFRSGSTLLWNLFRHTPGVTAFYEPLNERAWFSGEDDTLGTDPTHVSVSDYAAEYAGMADLGEWFDPTWTYRDLYMDRRSCDRGLERYLSELIRRAPHRPVLQCNRIDFRLPWLRAAFPDADVLLLYRNPREQWLSVQRSSSGAPPSRRLRVDEPEDYFYTLAWARDLRRYYPFLDPTQHEHAYAVHYLLWRLSFLAGQRYADMMIAYESLMQDHVSTLGAVFQRFDINGGELSADDFRGLLKAPTSERWPKYADQDWFAEIESDCEAQLARFFDA
jgi:hypothetical protein